MSAQLALPLALADHAVFTSFWRVGNEAPVAFLERLAATGEGSGAWLAGAEATGKSHLLQAVCERLGDDAAYVPLSAFAHGAPSVLEGLASRRCVCLDDVDAVAGGAAWERALFDLWNQLADAAGILVAAAAGAPRDCGFGLPDLESRMSRLPVFRLVPLPEKERVHALELRARARGLELPSETAEFLLRRTRRDMRSLYSLLDRLDAEAMRAQRRLTIPFVRNVLRES